MTPAQKKARANFKKAIAEAKKIRKKNPKLSQAQAVKQAWAILKKSKKVGAIKIIEKGETKKAKPKATYQVKRTAKGTYKGLKKVGAVKKSTHKDTKSHNVNIRVVSGVYKRGKLFGLPKYKDPEMARELELYADSDSQLYFQRKKPIILNLQKKYKKGTYNIEKAAKLWRYFIDAALQKYNKEFGSRGDKWYDLLNVSDRNLLALEYAENTKNEFDIGNFTIE